MNKSRTTSRKTIDNLPGIDPSALLATGGYDHTIKFWNISSAKCIKTFQHMDSQINSMDISRDRLLLAVAGFQHISLYDVNASNLAKPVVTCESMLKNVSTIGFDQKTRWLYTGGEDCSARIWDLRVRNVQCQKIFQINDAVNSVCLHPNQTELFVGDQSGIVHLWDTRNESVEIKPWVLPEPGSSINHVDVDSDGTMLAAINNKGMCFIWSLLPPAQQNSSTRLKSQNSKRVHERYVLKCRFSPDSTLLATTSADQTCRIWRTTNLDSYSTLRTGIQRWVWDCAFSSNSQYVVTGSSDGCSRLWRTEATADQAAMEAKPLREFTGHSLAVTALAFSDPTTST